MLRPWRATGIRAVSNYSAMAHTHGWAACPVRLLLSPRNASTDIGSALLPAVPADLTWDRSGLLRSRHGCDDCRHYAAGSAVVTARLFRHASDPDTSAPG
jgi:hypothetical protein